MVLAVMTVKYGLSQRRVNKTLKTENIQLLEERDQLNFKIDSLTSIGFKKTKAIKKASTNIDSKLKKDEEIIDNSDISDLELEQLLTRFRE